MKLVVSTLFLALSITAAANGKEIVKVLKFVNHTAKEIERNKAAIAKMTETVDGACFEKEILSAKLIQTNGMTSAEVLTKIRTTPVEVELEMYRNRFKNTVGYTYPSTKRIWMNRKYHDRMDPCDVGANLAHEVLGHKNGFKHDVKPSKARRFSVPYFVGSTVEKCCARK